MFGKSQEQKEFERKWTGACCYPGCTTKPQPQPHFVDKTVTLVEDDAMYNPEYQFKIGTERRGWAWHEDPKDWVYCGAAGCYRIMCNRHVKLYSWQSDRTYTDYLCPECATAKGAKPAFG